MSTQGQRMSMGYFAWPTEDTVMRGPGDGSKHYPPTTHKQFMKAKSKTIAQSLSRDPAVFESVQHLSFGMPTQVTAAAS